MVRGMGDRFNETRWRRPVAPCQGRPAAQRSRWPGDRDLLLLGPRPGNDDAPDRTGVGESLGPRFVVHAS
jgi:hypothetical protein